MTGEHMDRANGGTTTYLEGEHTMSSSTTKGRRGAGKKKVEILGSPEKDRTFWKLLSADDLDEEMPLVLALRQLRRVECRPLKVSPELLEHGYVSVAKAAKLLGVSVAQIRRRTSEALGEFVGEGRLPLVEAGIPISELLRAVLAERRKELEKAADQVVKLITIDGAPVQWRRWKTFEQQLAENLGYLNIPEAAAELGLSKSEVDRLSRDEGPGSLFAVKVGLRAGWCFTPEEIAAYKRKLQREREALHDTRVARAS
jgi:hypothetical protein